MRNNFCAFILTHGRADNVMTYNILRKHGYTGRIYLVIDNEDKTANEYYNIYGSEVIMFDKKEIAKTFDEADNFDNRKTIIYARNAYFKIAKDLNIDYFVQLDDDYNWFGFRTPEKSKPMSNLDNIFDLLVDFVKTTPASSIAMSQGGDHIGGYDPSKKIKRKAMNSFICSTDKPFRFVGRINEDVNSYTYQASIGMLFFSIMNIQLNQQTTQKGKGGMSDIYLEKGTYIKSFYTVIFQPSSVTIRMMGTASRRLHHSVKWDYTVPQILYESYKKPVMKFQYFSNKVNNPTPKGYVTLEQFIQGHRNPSDKLKDVFHQIASASSERKAHLKQNYLHYFTPCVNLNGGRKYTDIQSWTGLLVLDFDKIDNAPEIKQRIFDENSWIIASYLSPSGKGVKCLASIPECQSTDEFKERFYAMSKVVSKYPGFDSTSKNCVLPLFQSYDPELLYREDATTFEGREVVPNAYVPSKVAPIYIQGTDHDLQSVHNIISYSINKITSDGHPQVRGTSITLGGYVASGYIGQHEAEQLMENLIRSNGYLAKGIAGYVSTSKWAIKQGMSNQLILE